MVFIVILKSSFLKFLFENEIKEKDENNGNYINQKDYYDSVNNVNLENSSNIFNNLMTNSAAPRWPIAFKSTLAKIGPDRERISWVKHYYDWNKKGQRFDFYGDYISFPNAEWKVKCTIIFKGTYVWHIFPEEEECYLRSKILPPVSPFWLQNLEAKFEKNLSFRGLNAQLWTMKDPDDESHIMKYYCTGNNCEIPLRSPNQINDPGATDFYDTEIGNISLDTFEIPKYCEYKVSQKRCPYF